MAVCHSSATGWTEVDDLASLSDLREQSGTVLWAEADASHLEPSDIATIAEEFDLNPLAVEDAGAAKQRPKLETYEEHRFLVLHQLDEEDGQLEPMQLSCFVGPQYVLTIHHGARRTIEEAKRRWAGGDRLAEGSSRLLYTLLDVIVDDHQRHADALELEVEQLEEIALSEVDSPIQRQLYSLKQRIARMRRYALPVERILDELLRPDGTVPDQMVDLYRDVQDHMVRMNAQIRNVDELSAAALDLVRSEQADMLNRNSQKLAAWAAIFAVSTVVAGIYGMNFELFPDEGTLSGFWFAIGLMAALAGGLFVFFKRRGWL